MRKVILSFVLLLLIFGCIKDENELPIETNINNELSVDYVDIKDIGIEIPILNPIIETHKMLALNYSSSNKLRAVKQDVNAMKDVLVVYEEDDPKSYSISFENQSIERFANVVVVNDENDVPQTMVIEYLPDEESVRLYNTGRIGVEELSGTMHVYGSLADYIDQSQEVDHSQTKEKAPLSSLGSCGSVFGFNFGKGSMRGGGRGGSTEVCTLVKTVKACKAGGRGEHGPSQCGVGTGSTTIIRYECTKIYTSSIGSTLSNMVNTIFLNGRCGGSVSPKGNIGINAQFMPVTPCLDALTCAKADALIDELNSVLDTPLTKQQEKLIYEGGAFFDFAEAALVALENGGVVDVEDRLIYNPALDQDYRGRMAKKEKEIFDGLANYQKTQYLMSAQQAWKYAEIYHSESLYNGNGDAVRHAFWNALATVRLGEALTKKLTDAHESDPLEVDYTNHFKEREMDIFNNKVGRDIANKSGKLYLLVEEALKNGELRKLSNLADNRRATDSSQLIPTN